MNEKYENSIKMLKYHKDPFQRKLMTKEEVDFLLQLQKEMNTQDSLGNADPRYWVIRDWDKTYGKNLNNSDGILVFDNASGETICDIPNAVFDSVTAEICCSKIIQLINERLTEKLDKAATEDIEAKIRAASIVSSIEDAITEICNEYSLDIEVTDYEYCPSESGMFLTHKAALEHLRDNDYHYSSKVQTYGKVAWRSKEDLLWKILHETDWKQYLNMSENRKVNTMNPVRERILDQVSDAVYTDFSEHKDLIAFTVCSGYFEYNPDTDTDEESDFSELSVVVEKEWLFHFVKAKFDFKTDEEVRKYLQEEYTSDDSSEWYDEAIAANKVVMVNFN